MCGFFCYIGSAITFLTCRRKLKDCKRNSIITSTYDQNTTTLGSFATACIWISLYPKSDWTMRWSRY